LYQPVTLEPEETAIVRMALTLEVCLEKEWSVDFSLHQD
jgi:hypothetical protein